MARFAPYPPTALGVSTGPSAPAPARPWKARRFECTRCNDPAAREVEGDGGSFCNQCGSQVSIEIDPRGPRTFADDVHKTNKSNPEHMACASSDWTLSASVQLGVYTSSTCFGSGVPTPRSLRRVFTVSTARGSDARQMKVNKLIERTVERQRLPLGHNVMRQAKAASLRELAMTPGRAQRLTPSAVAVGSVATALAELGLGRSMEDLCAPTGTPKKDAFRAKRVIAQGYPALRAGKLDVTAAARRLAPSAVRGPNSATTVAAAVVRSSPHRAVCLGAVAEASTRLGLSTAVQTVAAAIAGKVWDSGEMTGSMPRTVAAGALLIASAHHVAQGHDGPKLSAKSVAVALGIHVSTAQTAYKKVANIVDHSTDAHPRHAAAAKVKVEPSECKTEPPSWYAATGTAGVLPSRTRKDEAADEDPDGWDAPSFSF